MDKAVADGKLTSDQETARLSDLQSHLDAIVNKTPPMHPHGPPPPGAPADGDNS